MTMERGKTAQALPAASVLLLRDGAEGLEVLMMERAKTMKFAPGAFVFPGGKVDPDDGDQEWWHGNTNAAKDCNDFSYRVAVLRELYEETSVLLTETPIESFDDSASFHEYFRNSSHVLDVESLVPFAHWVTPETMPRRFDTRFYVTAHNGQEAIHDGDEAVSLRWICPQKLLSEWGEDQVPLMFPTRLNLIKLARAENVGEALTQAQGTEVVKTMPIVSRDEQGVAVTIGENSGYGVTRATEKELRVERPK